MAQATEAPGAILFEITDRAEASSPTGAFNGRDD